jgi:pyruvate kinase
MCVDNLREALKQRPDKHCAIMLDTKGPEIRTGINKEGKPIKFVKGQSLEIVTDYSIEADNTRIACSYKSLPESVQVGGTIFIADGSLTCEVTEILEVRRSAENNYKSSITLLFEFLTLLSAWSQSASQKRC